MNPIELHHLTKFYGPHQGIKDISMTIEPGDIYGFIGPNGAGKTTTIRTLMNFVFPTSGSAKILGLDVVKESRKIKKLVGYLPAEDAYYPHMTAHELLCDTAYHHRLAKKDFECRAKELAEHLDIDLDRKIKKLSKGNKRKISIIRALLHRPKVLIFDEPTNGLDPLVRERFFDLVKEENRQGATILFSSHVLSDVQRMCNKVSIIKDGSIIEDNRIDLMQGNQYKKVVLSFKSQATVQPVTVDGMGPTTVNQNDLSFVFDGDVSELLAHLVHNNIHHQLSDIRFERSNLDEIFMDYYTNGNHP